jgi:hypothetical protein
MPADDGRVYSWTGQAYVPTSASNLAAAAAFLSPDGSHAAGASDQSSQSSQPSFGGIVQTQPDPPNYAETNAATNGGNPAFGGLYWEHLGKAYRSGLAATAFSHVDQVWFPVLVWTTCNMFVGDMLREERDKLFQSFPPLKGSWEFDPPQKWYVGSFQPPQWTYIQAKDWFNPDYADSVSWYTGGTPLDGQVRGAVQCWTPVPGGPDSAQAGDILATSSHVGIVYEPGTLISAGTWPATVTPGRVLKNDYGWRTTGKYGLKKDSRVKRFTCF